VKLLSDIKRKIGILLLTNKVRKHKRQRAFINFDKAKSIGVIFNASRHEVNNIAKNFIISLHKKDINVYALGYIKNQESIDYPNDDFIRYFSIPNDNWYIRPNIRDVNEFYGRPLDMLIDLNSDDILPLKYVVGLSNAKFKIGPGTSSYNLFYDFILNVEKNAKLPFYIDQVNHYMSVMKTV
jgi:hypothetical protein